MKKIFSILFFLISTTLLSEGQNLPYLDSSTFNAGETIKYKLKYGFITAAEATIQVTTTDIKFNNKPT